MIDDKEMMSKTTNSEIKRKRSNLFRQEVKHSKKETIPVGFDLEWPFSFKTGSGKTALAQICLEESTCYLLHIYSLKKLPVAFIEFLCHSKVKLVGVNVKKLVDILFVH